MKRFVVLTIIVIAVLLSCGNRCTPPSRSLLSIASYLLDKELVREMKAFQSNEKVYRFIKRILPGVRYVWLRGWDLLVVVSHAALESGWGNSELAKRYNNYFGIKGKGVEMITVEYVDGRRIKQYAFFRKYDSVEECFLDYDYIVKEEYPEAYAVRWDYKSYFRLIAARWATDPLYYQKLCNIYNFLHTLYMQGR